MLYNRTSTRASGFFSNIKYTSVFILYTALFFSFSAFGINGQTPGSLDTSFDVDGKVTHTFASIDTANSIIKQPDGKLIVAGWAKTPSALALAVSRLNADGSLDTSFDSDGRVMFPITSVSRGYAAALQPDGKIVVAGSSGNGFDENFAAARFNSDGSIDTTFNGTGYQVIDLSYTDTAYSVAIQPDGKIVLIGTADSDFGVVRLNANGTLDASFDGDGKILTQVGPGNLSDKAYAGLLQADGKIVAVGFADAGNNSFQTAIVRYNPDGSLDSTFDTDGKALIPMTGQSSNAYAVAEQADGKLVVGGKNTVLSPFATDMTLLRLNADGTLDTSFDGDGRAYFSTSVGDESINALAIQADGKILAAGYGSAAGSSPGFDSMLLRVNSDGSLDNSFDNDGILQAAMAIEEDRARALLLDADGKIFVAGFRAHTTSRQYEFAVLKLNQSGSRDSSFSSDGLVSYWVGADTFVSEQINALATQADGKIVAAGTVGNTFALARYNADGSLDLTFDADGRLVLAPLDNANNQSSAIANAVAIQPDGKIVAAGAVFDSGISTRVIVVARFLPDGSPDASFDGDGKLTTRLNTWLTSARAVAVQPDGRIVVAGETSPSTSKTNIVVARYNPDGSPDTSFDGDGILTTTIGTGYDAAFSLALQRDGKIVAAGTSATSAFGMPQFAAVRYNADGTLDTSFDGDGKFVSGWASYAYSVAVQRDGKIVLGGSGGGVFAAMRLTAAGALDSTFGQGGIATTVIGYRCEGRSMALQGDGKVIVAGFSQPSQFIDSDFALVRYNSNGSLDSTFDTDGIVTTPIGTRGDEVYAVALQRDGKIVAAGKSFSSETQDDFALARYRSGYTPILNGAYFDFDGDSKSDISIFRPTDGSWWYLNSGENNSTFRVYSFGTETDLLAPGDFTGDGKTDLAVFRPANGTWYIQRSEDNSFFSFPFGTNGDIPAANDYDGDGKTDAAVFRPSSATWYILNSSGTGTSIVNFGADGDKPATADFDGDGKADIAIFRPSDGSWWYLRSSDNQYRVFRFGEGTDKPVQGDYTGDGKADIAVFRPSTGEWFFQRSEDNSYYSFIWGQAGDLAAPGDYDGDGRFDAAVFRPSTGTWYVNRSSAGVLITNFGTNGDIPVPGSSAR